VGPGTSLDAMPVAIETESSRHLQGTTISIKTRFCFRFPNLFAICIHIFKYNQQIVC
jgi:hypothetical protein